MPAKLVRCVKHLQDQGKSKSSAYAICSKSTGWQRKSGGGWKNVRTGKTFGGK